MSEYDVLLRFKYLHIKMLLIEWSHLNLCNNAWTKDIALVRRVDTLHIYFGKLFINEETLYMLLSKVSSHLFHLKLISKFNNIFVENRSMYKKLEFFQLNSLCIHNTMFNFQNLKLRKLVLFQ